MSFHILINISSDNENLYGVRFFHSFFKDSSPGKVTLFHINRLDSKNSSHTLMEIWNHPENDGDDQLSDRARKSLARATRYLDGCDVTIDEVKTKTVKERFGKVKDILTESSRGLYDAMILGRRATYALQWMFDRPGDEVSQALIRDTSLECPLWICSEPEEGRNNVLLCVDGSPSSLRAADHVGYILSKVKHHKVMVLHVTTTRTSNIKDILQEATDVLLSHDIAPERIESKRGWGLSVPGAILSEKNSGRYAAVAVGLQGNSGGVLNSMGLQGGTTATLIKKISKAALWCCP